MGKVTRFTCPNCGGEVLIKRIKIKSIPNFDVATCKGCGYTITEEDIRKHGLQIAENMLAKLKL